LDYSILESQTRVAQNDQSCALSKTRFVALPGPPLLTDLGTPKNPACDSFGDLLQADLNLPMRDNTPIHQQAIIPPLVLIADIFAD
jgi:hypothetical protein